jgi:hypothetical protein
MKICLLWHNLYWLVKYFTFLALLKALGLKNINFGGLLCAFCNHIGCLLKILCPLCEYFDFRHTVCFLAIYRSGKFHLNVNILKQIIFILKIMLFPYFFF